MYINQQETHKDGCHTLCGTSEDGVHLNTCKLYACPECGELINQVSHPTDCILYACNHCGALLNQNEEHAIDCHSLCNCGYPENTHTPGCKIYKCEYCGVFGNQGEAHYDYRCDYFPCPDCGKVFRQEGTTEGCICYYHVLFTSVQDADGNILDGAFYEPEVYIAFVDKSQPNITFFADWVAEFDPNTNYTSLDMASCPDYLIVFGRYGVGSENKYYDVDSFDMDIYNNYTGYYKYAEPKYFTRMVKDAVGLYATLVPMESDATVYLYAEPNAATEPVAVPASDLAGEYVVEFFNYEYNPETWFFKLTPDTNWPEEAEGCVWIPAEYVTLSQNSTQQPQAPTHSEGCGDECTVEGCTCVCHNDLLKYFSTATNLEELDDMVLATTEEQWNTFPEEAWPWLEQLYASRPTSYKIFGATEYDPPVEGEICYPTVDFTNAAGFRPPVTGQ